MSSETFKKLEADFSLLMKDLNSKLDDSLHKLTDEARKNFERDIQCHLDELQRILEKLNVEARRVPDRDHPNYRLEAYKRDLNILKIKVEKKVEILNELKKAKAQWGVGITYTPMSHSSYQYPNQFRLRDYIDIKQDLDTLEKKVEEKAKKVARSEYYF